MSSTYLTPPRLQRRRSYTMSGQAGEGRKDTVLTLVQESTLRFIVPARRRLPAEKLSLRDSIKNSELSGGEKQRVGWSRKSNALKFVRCSGRAEPSSAMDPEAEADIVSKISKTIAQGAGLCMAFGVRRTGSVAEAGTHGELMAWRTTASMRNCVMFRIVVPLSMMLLLSPS
ncbi:uncharacterized protein BT62DRAFT_1079957 [Guyanagaster necrorhizus]|uniref:Uncharacterized protein n=1 Tax=Guyanagaster necrorhizus TaxID=856835 RepID=A0A9P7VKK6_9AGAR|nr:uncharacterized protein BT62DRAFT_1079957 [Guyanagaster necrorhizus MCA 3950]KAG7441614.1 hypothetical protein BT62DRAFT_1079957 [Guyanagaster necrorhizus MCA 3950]